MATNNKVPYGYGGPVPRDEPEQAPTPEPKSCSSCACGKGYVGAAVFMFACLAVMFGALCYFGTKRHSHPSKTNLEVKQAGDVDALLRKAVADPRFDALAASNPRAEGEQLWKVLIRGGLIDVQYVGKFTSLNSKMDMKPEYNEFLDNDAIEQPWCSYTAPRIGELKQLLLKKGKDRVVLFAFNSRNWDNYATAGVLIFWSDAEMATYVTRDEAHEEFGITAEEWADPAGKLFGKKAPFQFTYE
jgi:hypothetical protein